MTKQKHPLKDLRSSIDNLDLAVLAILAERFRLTEKVGKLKVKLKLPVEDKSREKHQRALLRRTSRQLGLDEHFASDLLDIILIYVKRRHRALRKSAKK